MRHFTNIQRVDILTGAITNLSSGTNRHKALSDLEELRLDMLHDSVRRPQWEHKYEEWSARSAFPESIEQLIEEGWSLVSVQQTSPLGIKQGYFKRPKQ